MSRIIPFIISAALLISSCRHGGNPPAAAHSPVDILNVSGRLKLEKVDGATRVTVTNPWQNSTGKELIWYLVPRDSAVPQDAGEDQIIRVPVSRVVCMSVTHIAMLRALDAGNVIVGISGSSLVYDSVIREGIRSGRIRDVGYEGNLNRELIISLNPDLLMAYGVADPSSGSTARLADAGVKVFYNADYLEEDPLARCEWLRLFGILTGKEQMADSIVSSVSETYGDLVALVRASPGRKPAVMLGSPWEDVWYISPGNSYIGRLIEDAGGHYIYSDMTRAHSVPLSVESVFRKAEDADIWINPGTADRLSDILSGDQRMASLRPFREGNVWNNRRRITADDGNDYWESAVVRPDLLLRDLVSIIRPELLPGHVQYYYRKLE